jgi:hypothetical protein
MIRDRNSAPAEAARTSRSSGRYRHGRGFERQADFARDVATVGLGYLRRLHNWRSAACAIALAGILTVLGCTRHAPSPKVFGTTMFLIGEECHATARMTGCSIEQSPPVCAKIFLKFTKGCERIVVK